MDLSKQFNFVSMQILLRIFFVIQIYFVKEVIQNFKLRYDKSKGLNDN